MDPLVLLFVAIQGLLLAFLAAQSIARGRQLDGIAAILRPDAEQTPPADDPPMLVLGLRDRADALAWQLDQQRHDAAYLADLIGVGIVHLDDQLRVDQANAAAHVFLDRTPGSLLGQPRWRPSSTAASRPS